MIQSPPRPETLPLPVRRRKVTPADRVRAGAKLLDKDLPGWPERINPATLDLTNGAYCVLGQLYGGFDKACNARGWSYLGGGATVRYGFVTPRRSGAVDEFNTEYAELTELWRAEIARRLMP